ncbi:MAG: hypothetical protein KDD46_07460 [Bdellovibrionales bacterium]|nr:hypothetical protein [Bdellovibrionales bacterium]
MNRSKLHFKGLSKRSQGGFSFIEMLLASVVFVGLSAVTYSFLQKQQTQQLSAVKFQAQNRASNTAIERFKADASLVDPNWITLGVPAVYPHQGLGLGSNYYADSIMQSEVSLTDGVTFLRRDTDFDYYLTLNTSIPKFCLGTTADPNRFTDPGLYSSDIGVDEYERLKSGDWILVFNREQSALGTVVSKQGSTIRLRAPNDQEKQAILSNVSGQFTGLITKAGVLPTTVDVQGKYTSGTSDNYYCFEKDKMRLQKIGNPVSYLLQYATNDGKEKSHDNLYLLDSNGQKRKMLTRIEYAGSNEKREYLTEVSNIELTYDLLASATESIEKGVGRGAYRGFLLNTSNNYFSDSFSNSSIFHFASNIIAINLNIVNEGQDQTDPTKTVVKNHTVKASFDTMSGQTTMVENVSYESYKTANLNLSKVSSNAYDENIGKPFYYAFNDEESEIVIPLWRHMTDGSIFSKASGQSVDDDGRIAIFKKNGGPVNAENNCEGNNCAPSDRSSIVFRPVTTGNTISDEDGSNIKEVSKFFPTTINTIEMSGYSVMVVGGVAMTGSYETSKEGTVNWAESADGLESISTINDGRNECGTRGCEVSSQLQRTAGFATVIVPSGMPLAELVYNQYDADRPSCNIGGCHWTSIPQTNGDGVYANDLSGLMDSANLARTVDGKLLIVPMTKKERALATGIYQLDVGVENDGMGDFAMPIVTHIADINITQNNRIITAIAERTTVIEGEEYLPVCTSVSLSSVQAEGENLEGEIRLMRVSDLKDSGIRDNTGVKIASHNYTCSSLSLTENGDLLAAGRLSILPITHSEMKSIVRGEGLAPELLLDDIAYINNGSPVYADGFRVEPSTYSAQDAQIVGWRNGLSSVNVGNQIALAGTNTVRLDMGGTINQIMDVGIHFVDLPTAQDRVLVSIQTDPININNTVISSTYVEGDVADGSTPATFVPGNYVVDPNNPRTSPTPLPTLGSAMSEYDWYTLFRQLQNPRGPQGLDTEMPSIQYSNFSLVSCQDAYTQTCQGN